MRENQIYGSRAQVAVKVEEWGHEPVASRSWKNSLDADSSLEPFPYFDFSPARPISDFWPLEL